MLGPVLKVVLALLLPAAFVLLLVFGISGSVLVSLGYGFFTPLVATLLGKVDRTNFIIVLRYASSM